MSGEKTIERILADWRDRRDRGDAPTPEELAREHPELAEEILASFEAIGVIGGLFAVPEDPAAGGPRLLGDYRILREIGRGGMGVVYEAEQTSMGRRVALKVLSPAVTSVHQAVQRFHREARAAGQIHHTNIVPVYAMGEDRGLHYYAMELVEGETLAGVVGAMRDRLADGEPSPGESRLGLSTTNEAGWTRLAEAFAGVAEALEAAHEEGILHRDVKPTNLLVTDDGTLKLVDFGLARLTGEGGSMTVTGQLLGTPHYMSPEQARAREVPVDHRTDVYSLGATLYEVLTLRTPFLGDTLHEICSQILSRDPPSIRNANPRVPRDLETIVVKAMEKDLDRRYASAGEMARDLRRFAEGVPIRARRIGIAGRTWRKVRRNKVRAALVAAVVVLAAVGGLLALRAAREAARRTELEYAALCAEAEEAVARSMELVAGTEFGGDMRPGETARDLFTQAIALLPERTEAYFGRALAPGRTLDERLSDLDAARAQGLPDGTWRLARIHLLRTVGRWKQAREEERGAPAAPSTAPECYFLARLRASTGQVDEALALLDRALEDADSAAVRYLALRHRATLRTWRDDLPGALSDLHALQALGDESARLRLWIAALWRRRGLLEDADREFEEALERTRRIDDATAWIELARSCWMVGPWLDRVTAEAVEGREDEPEVCHTRGFALLRLGRSEEALAIFEGAVRREPGSAEAHLGLARTHRERRSFDEALRAYGQAIALAPDLAAAYHERGGLLNNHLGRYEEAVADLRRALELEPGQAATRLAAGFALEHAGRPAEGLVEIECALAVAPEYLRARIGRWGLLRKVGRGDEARDAIAAAAKHPGRGPAALALRGRALFELERYVEALEVLEEAIRLDPDLTWCARLDVASAPGVRLYRASLLGHVGRHQECLDACDAVLEDGLLPFWQRAHAHHLRGEAFCRLGRHEEAIAAYDLALEIDHESLPEQGSNILSDRGACLCDHLDRPEQALESFDRALELDCENAVIHGNRGVALGKLAKQHPRGSAERHALLRKTLEARRRSTRLDPANMKAHLYLAETLRHLGHHAESLAAADRAVELDSEDARSHTMRANALAALGRREQALEARRRAVAIDPGNPELLRQLGSGLARAGHGEKALAVLDPLVERDPDDALTHVCRSSALAMLGNHAGAIRAAEQALRIDEDLAEAHYLRGGSLHALGRDQEALEATDRALALEPDLARVHSNRALALDDLGRHADALVALDRALAIDPGLRETRPVILANRAMILAHLGLDQEALDDLDAHLRLRPDDPTSHFDRALRLMNLGRYGEALESAERAAALDPDYSEDPLYLHLRCNALVSLGRGKESLSASERLIELAPRSSETRCLRGQALRALGRLDEALREYDRAIELDPGNGKAHRNRGVILFQVGRHEEAARDFRRLVELEPRNLGARTNLAYVLRCSRRAEEALDAYRETLRLDSRNADALLGCAIVLGRDLGRSEEALTVLARLIEIDSRNAWARYWRGHALSELERYAEALAEFDLAISILPASPEASRVHCGRAGSLVGLGRYEEALVAARQSETLRPDHVCSPSAYALLHLGRTREALAVADRVKGPLGVRLRIAVLCHQGRFDDALPLVDRLEGLVAAHTRIEILRRLGRDAEARTLAKEQAAAEPPAGQTLVYAWLAALAGERKCALALLGRAGEPRKPSGAYVVASVQAILGDADEALRWLERAVEAGHRIPAGSPADPDFRGIEEDPRYRVLLDKLRRKE